MRFLQVTSLPAWIQIHYYYNSHIRSLGEGGVVCGPEKSDVSARHLREIIITIPMYIKYIRATNRWNVAYFIR